MRRLSWQDLAIAGIVLFLLYAMWQGISSDSDSGPSYRPLVETNP